MGRPIFTKKRNKNLDNKNDLWKKWSYLAENPGRPFREVFIANGPRHVKYKGWTDYFNFMVSMSYISASSVFVFFLIVWLSASLATSFITGQRHGTEITNLGQNVWRTMNDGSMTSGGVSSCRPGKIISSSGRLGLCELVACVTLPLEIVILIIFFLRYPQT